MKPSFRSARPTWLWLVLFVLICPIGCSAQAGSGELRLIADPSNRYRPLALNSATLTTEPFDLTTEENLSTDKRTRLTLFATGITDLTVMKMRDRDGREAIALTESRSWLIGDVTQIVALVPSGLDGSLTIWLEDQGRTSNALVAAFRSTRPPPAQVTIVFDGNSLTAGYDTQKPLPVAQTYPYQVCTELLREGYNVDCYNKGIGGQTTTEMLARAPSVIDPLLENRTSIAVVWEIGNDLMFTTSTEAQLFDHLKLYCAERRKRGAKIVVMSVPWRADIAARADKEAIRIRLNERLRREYAEFADVLVDLDADPRLLKLMQPDKVHYTPNGYATIAENAMPALRTLLAPR